LASTVCSRTLSAKVARKRAAPGRERGPPRSIMTMYDTVTWDGHQFAGHWSWIYVARNDPRHRGTRIWQWMARQEA